MKLSFVEPASKVEDAAVDIAPAEGRPLPIAEGLFRDASKCRRSLQGCEGDHAVELGQDVEQVPKPSSKVIELEDGVRTEANGLAPLPMRMR